MTKKIITEKRKRQTEEYACDEDRTRRTTRMKSQKTLSVSTVLNEMFRYTISDEFISQIPLKVLYDFVRSSLSLKIFLCSRNYSKTLKKDITWLSQTGQYKDAVAKCLDKNIERALRKQEPLKILRDYRGRKIPLSIYAYPSSVFTRLGGTLHNDYRLHNDGKNVSLPLGCNLYVNQVFSSNKLKVRMTRDQMEEDRCLPSLEKAWDIVAGPGTIHHNDQTLTVKEINNNVYEWMDGPHDTTDTILALSVILLDPSTEKMRPFYQHYKMFKIEIRCLIDDNSQGRGRKIVFYFSSDVVKRSKEIFDAVEFPPEIHSCISGYL
jgi:hypothetical protein